MSDKHKLAALVKNNSNDELDVILFAWEHPEFEGSEIELPNGVNYRVIDVVSEAEFERSKQFLWRDMSMRCKGFALYMALAQNEKGEKKVLEIALPTEDNAQGMKITEEGVEITVLEVVPFKDAKEVLSDWMREAVAGSWKESDEEDNFEL